MADFDVFAPYEDASKYGFDIEDFGIRSEMEGGYIITRARFTRSPRRTWTTGLTDISNDEFNSFVAFYNNYGTFKSFTYSVKTSNEVVTVRLQQKPTFTYAGSGTTYRWDVTEIKLEEV